MRIWGILFFVSGLASLVYQTLWVRSAAFTLGSSAVAMSVVISIFCLGLGLGSAALGLKLPSDRPGRRYAFLEFGIAGLALPLQEYFFRLPDWTVTVFPAWAQSSFARMLFVGIAIFPPALLMGATFPQMVRICQSGQPQDSRGLASWAYAVNTWGAVVGSLLAGFCLLPLFGVSGAYYSAVLLSFGVGIAALLWDQKSLQKTANAEETSVSTKPSLGSWLRQDRHWMAASIAAAVGFAALAQEIVWSKYLGILFGANIYGLSAVLALTLAGVASGGVFAFIVQRYSWFNTGGFGICFGLAALGIPVLSLLLAKVPLLTINAAAMPFALPLAVWKLCFVIFFFLPPAILGGAMLPCLIEFLSRSQARREASLQAAGFLYAANLIGGIVGAASSGLILIPNFGSSAALKVAIAAYLAATILVCKLERSQQRLPSWRQSIILLLIFLQGLSLGMPTLVDFRPALLTAYWQRQPAKGSIPELRKALGDDTENFRKVLEGHSGVVSLSTRPREDQNRYLWLKVNGLNESYFTVNSQNPDLAIPEQELPRYEALLALLPLAANPNAKSAFLIGYGGGHTASFLASRNLDRVVVAELEAKVLAATRSARGQLIDTLSPKNKIIVDDARRVLTGSTEGSFDIVLSQPSHSWISGVANLFTVEFFRSVSRNLTEQGVFAQWLNLYNTDKASLQSIVGAFFEVFPYGAIFSDSTDSEMIMVGSNTHFQFSGAYIASLAADRHAAAVLRQVPIRGEHDLAAYYLMSRSTALEFSKGATINSDRNGFAEIRQSKFVYQTSQKEVMKELEPFDRGDFEPLFSFSDGNRADLLLNTAESIQRRSNNPLRFFRIFRELETLSTLSPEQRIRLGRIAYRFELYASAEKQLLQALAQTRSKDALSLLVGNYLAAFEVQKADAALLRFDSSAGGTAFCYLWELHQIRKEPVTAPFPRDRLRKSCGTYAEKIIGDAELQSGSFAAARDAYESYYALDPQDLYVIHRLGLVYAALGDQDRADQWKRVLKDATNRDLARLDALAKQHERFGFPEDAKWLRQRIQGIRRYAATPAS